MQGGTRGLLGPGKAPDPEDHAFIYLAGVLGRGEGAPVPEFEACSAASAVIRTGIIGGSGTRLQYCWTAHDGGPQPTWYRVRGDNAAPQRQLGNYSP